MQITALCVVTALLAMTVKRGSPESALLLSLGAAVLVMAFLVKALREVIAFLEELGGKSGVPTALFLPLYKTAGIALVVRLGGNLCRDAGESALAAMVELGGSVCALVTALPLLRAVLELLTELMR